MNSLRFTIFCLTILVSLSLFIMNNMTRIWNYDENNLRQLAYSRFGGRSKDDIGKTTTTTKHKGNRGPLSPNQRAALSPDMSRLEQYVYGPQNININPRLSLGNPNPNNPNNQNGDTSNNLYYGQPPGGLYGRGIRQGYCGADDFQWHRSTGLRVGWGGRLNVRGNPNSDNWVSKVNNNRRHRRRLTNIETMATTTTTTTTTTSPKRSSNSAAHAYRYDHRYRNPHHLSHDKSVSRRSLQEVPDGPGIGGFNYCQGWNNGEFTNLNNPYFQYNCCCVPGRWRQERWVPNKYWRKRGAASFCGHWNWDDNTSPTPMPVYLGDDSTFLV